MTLQHSISPDRTAEIAVPLCVDLDGTLIKTDILHEAVFMLIRANFIYIFMLPFWLMKGKAHLKAQIATRVQPKASNLPFNPELLKWLTGEKEAGRQLILATASNQRYAEAIAEHLGIFDSIEASSEMVNLSGSKKEDRLVERFGASGFDYVGNCTEDYSVWDKARKAIIVGDEAGARRYASRPHAEQLRNEEDKASALKVWAKAIRVHQWLKNSLLFVPSILASRYFGWDTAFNLAIAFFAFSFCASAVYLFNDLIDIEVDRRHKTKHKRPLAAGLIQASDAVFAAMCLLSAGLFLSLQLPVEFTIILVIYFFITSAYSILIKSFLLLDVLTLAGLFTLRIMAGSAAVGGIVSTWLLAFSMFFFLSLALVKRYVEISSQLAEASRASSGRGYQASDMETLAQAGMSSGFAAVVVLALFIDSPAILKNYTNPQAIWLVCPLVLYLLMRIWVLARRNEMNDDPVVFLMTDWRSQIMIAAGAAVMLLSQLL